MWYNVIINYTRQYIKKTLGLNKRKLFPPIRRKSDVWLVSFPKSGNTWVRFILGNLMVGYRDKNDMEMNFGTMQEIVPDIYLSHKIPYKLKFPPFPRIIKTHEKYDKKYENSIYVIRNPKDALVSYYHFIKDGYGRDIKNFSNFLRNENFGIKAWCEHINSWIGNADVVVKYEDLKTDPERQTRKIIDFLKIDMDSERIQKAVELSSFNRMKRLERQDESWKTKHKLKKEYAFVRKGETNQWKKYFNERDLDYFNEIIGKNGLREFLVKMNYN